MILSSKLLPLPAGPHFLLDGLNKLLVTPGPLQGPLPGPGAAVPTDEGHLVKVVYVQRFLSLLLVEDGIVVTVLVDSHLLQVHGGAHVLESARADTMPFVDGSRRSVVVVIFGMLLQYPSKCLDGPDNVALTGGRVVVGGPQFVDLRF